MIDSDPIYRQARLEGASHDEARLAIVRLDAEWDEEKHLRDKAGRFGSGGSEDIAREAYHQAIHEGANHDQARDELHEAAVGEGATHEEAERLCDDVQQEYHSNMTGLDDEGKIVVGATVDGYTIGKQTPDFKKILEDQSGEEDSVISEHSIENAEGKLVAVLHEFSGDGEGDRFTVLNPDGNLSNSGINPAEAIKNYDITLKKAIADYEKFEKKAEAASEEAKGSTHEEARIAQREARNAAGFAGLKDEAAFHLKKEKYHEKKANKFFNG